ncbi:hypothetical protein ABZ619_04600 [Streptomyces sp. NPDC007851]
MTPAPAWHGRRNSPAACRPGTLVVACTDLVAQWVPATDDENRP